MAPMNSDMEEIWAILAQEGRENLSAVEDTLLKLEKKPDSREEIAVLFRALHTFKGTVRMMDFSTTEQLAHHAEDLGALVRDEGVALDEEMIELLLVAMDRMRTLLDHILNFHSDVDPTDVAVLSSQLHEMVERKKGIKTSQASTPEEPILPQDAPVIEIQNEFVALPQMEADVTEMGMAVQEVGD
jgi:two-component system, chemotaxis family, sensor kinase CheA